MNAKPRVAVIGLGYFGQFHLHAWSQSRQVDLVAICDQQRDTLDSATARFGVTGFTHPSELLAEHTPDIVDIVTPPAAHAALIRSALKKDRLLVCQKPFCESLRVAQAVATEVKAAGARLVIHENFRFQPWYRTLKPIVDSGELGTLYQCRFALRPGDGRGKDAYLARQPAFQHMQRFLIRETGVHFIDLFRWLFGEIDNIYADLRQLNPHIAGEDAGHLIMQHSGGVVSVFDGNRLADHAADNHRLTMGEMLLEAEKATIRLDGFGKLWRRNNNAQRESEIPLTQRVDSQLFGGGCVQAVIQHVIDGYVHGDPLENEICDYLKVMKIADACYESASTGQRISL